MDCGEGEEGVGEGEGDEVSEEAEEGQPEAERGHGISRLKRTVWERNRG